VSRYKKISDYKLLLKRAEEMLLNPTPAEKKLRIQLLQNFKEADFKFQVVMVPFIVDNVSIKHRLIIEIDGSIHDHTLDSDEIRQRNLEGDGYRFLRFTNNEILNDMSNVLKLIEFELQKPSPPRQRTQYARTKKSRRFSRPPLPVTIGDRSIIDPVSGKPYRPDTDDEIDEMAEMLAEEITVESKRNEVASQQKRERIKQLVFRKHRVLEMNKERKFACQKCKSEIKLNESRTAHRINGEFVGWTHLTCK
jgi:very-short-patch-repair endonuclease